MHASCGITSYVFGERRYVQGGLYHRVVSAIGGTLHPTGHSLAASLVEVGSVSRRGPRFYGPADRAFRP
jgi:hypothetical protein